MSLQRIMPSAMGLSLALLLLIENNAYAQEWDYAYYANTTPNSTRLPATDRWIVTQKSAHLDISGGLLTLATSQHQHEYQRTVTMDSRFASPDLTVEFRAQTFSTNVHGMVVGNVFPLGAGQSSFGVWVLPDALMIESPTVPDLIRISINPGMHIFRFTRSVSSGAVHVYIDRMEVWSGGLGAPFLGGTNLNNVNLFIGDSTVTALDYLAYTVGELSPSLIDSPQPYRMPFAGQYPITQGPNCPGGDHTGPTAEALDYGLPVGTQVFAAAPGVVQVAQLGKGKNAPAGLYIEIAHDDGSFTVYAHLHTVSVTVGTVVPAGYPIALSGGDPSDPNAGSSTGHHLHFKAADGAGTPVSIREIPVTTWISGTADDPCQFVLLDPSDPTSRIFGSATGSVP